VRPESSASPDARPPIQSTEAELAEDAICHRHKGLIAQSGGIEGQVYWCPIGRQYWRYRKDNQNAGFTSILRYPRTGVV
jgi:hypothetical protein